FEPTRAFTLPVFETGALGLYATLPDALYGKWAIHPRLDAAADSTRPQACPGGSVGVGGLDHADDVGFVHRDERHVLRAIAVKDQRVGQGDEALRLPIQKIQCPRAMRAVQHAADLAAGDHHQRDLLQLTWAIDRAGRQALRTFGQTAHALLLKNRSGDDRCDSRCAGGCSRPATSSTTVARSWVIRSRRLG